MVALRAAIFRDSGGTPTVRGSGTTGATSPAWRHGRRLRGIASRPLAD